MNLRKFNTYAAFTRKSEAVSCALTFGGLKNIAWSSKPRIRPGVQTPGQMRRKAGDVGSRLLMVAILYTCHFTLPLKLQLTRAV